MSRLQFERDLFLQLLELTHSKELRALLEKVLELSVEATRAERGYLELFDDGDRTMKSTWSLSRGCSDREMAEIQAVTSKGIIAATIAAGETLHVPMALLDDRFASGPSVRDQRLEAVLCTPIGGREPMGVLYLEGRRGAGPFADEDVQLVEIIARHIGPAAQRLILEERERASADETKLWRERLRCDGFIGRSRATGRVLQQAALVAPLEVSVLITGDSGTGKTQLARIIHENSPRCSGPFVELNCAALPEGLIESELFGAMPGAYGQLNRRLDGKISAAEHGTLFLDEIGELAPPVQAKLLQVLQSRSYFMLGSTKLETADVRIIAATNAQLDDMVREKKFREDLYYRLSVLSIRMPSLAERHGDISPLADFLLDQAVRRHRLSDLRFSTQARFALEMADWPGNVRQLGNVIEAAAIQAAGTGGVEVLVTHLFPNEDPDPPPLTPAPGDALALPFQEATKQFQKKLVSATLEATGWNVMQAARRLEVARSHVNNLIRAYGLVRPARRG